MFSSQDEFLESLARYFTKYIFDCVGFSYDKQIPLETIKEVIKSADGEAGQLLAMFCGAE